MDSVTLLLNIFETNIPITNPVLKFLLILIIILLAPLILNKFKIPHLLGLIIAGAIIGPHGINLIERDSSIILSGTVGLLYIMFLAGLEIDWYDFKKNSTKSFVFGMYTFSIPMTIGTIVGYYLLNFSIETSVLLASMFASHTLLAYPLISRMGVAKNRAVSIAVGGTVVTDTLALLVLAVIVGMVTGGVNEGFWIRLTISVILFGLIVMLLFPIIGRWYFKRFGDNVTQYIFVLVMVFFGAVLAEIAKVEAIIGAFLTGLAFNRLIPKTSPLMNRIEFVGNAIFIPFFLIGVGMLIDYRAFFKGWETIKVAIAMVIVATSAKFIAAWLTQKTYKLTVDERRLIFGLSNAQAAATLAAVMVGYNIILGYTEKGEPIRLLGDSILNGTIVMILFTCTIATIIAQKGAKNIALLESYNDEKDSEEQQEKILIATNNIDITEHLVSLGITLKSEKQKDGLYALTIVENENPNGASEKYAKKVLNKAVVTASATDHLLHELLRYDTNVVTGISNVVKEHKIKVLILGVLPEKDISNTFFINLTEKLLSKTNVTTFVYKPRQPLGTIKRHIVVIPENAEREIGFVFWLIKVWNIAKNTGGKLVFYTNDRIIKILEEINEKHPIELEFKNFYEWNDFLIISRDVQLDDNLIIIMSRKDNPSYNNSMSKIPTYLNKYFKDISFIIIYPMQLHVSGSTQIDLKDPTFLEPIEKFDELGKTILRVFKRNK